MNRPSSGLASTLSAVQAMAMAIGGCAATAPAKPAPLGNTIPPPEYETPFKSGNYRSAESDSRPGAHFFHDGRVALRKGDVRHAIHMYQVSASWAFKPAAYMPGRWPGHALTTASH